MGPPLPEGLRAGLLRSIHPPEPLLSDAEASARRLINGRSRTAMAMSGHNMRRNAALASPLEVHKIESLALFYASKGDGREGVQAFKEKRPPSVSSLIDLSPLQDAYSSLAQSPPSV